MKVTLFAVYDSASGVYDGPFPGKAEGHVIRSFSDQCLNADGPMGAHPEDFTLFKIGTWNDGTAELVDEITVKLINGAEAVANSRNSIVQEGVLDA